MIAEFLIPPINDVGCPMFQMVKPLAQIIKTKIFTAKFSEKLKN